MEDTKLLESGHHGSSVTWEVSNGLPLEGAWNHLTGTLWEMLVEESDNGQEGNFLFDGSFMFPMDFSDSTATLFHTGHTEKSFMWPSSPTINGVGSPAPSFSKSASSLATLFQAGNTEEFLYTFPPGFPEPAMSASSTDTLVQADFECLSFPDFLTIYDVSSFAPSASKSAGSSATAASTASTDTLVQANYGPLHPDFPTTYDVGHQEKQDWLPSDNPFFPIFPKPH